MLGHRLHGAFYVKAVAVVLVFLGLSEKSAALISGGVGFFIGGIEIRNGIKEQYWEPPNQQRARLWDDLVWGHSSWINPETPEEGIARLVTPHLQDGQWNAGTGSSTANARSTSWRDRWSSLRKNFRSAGAIGRRTPSVSTEPLAPHFLEVR